MLAHLINKVMDGGLGNSPSQAQLGRKIECLPDGSVSAVDIKLLYISRDPSKRVLLLGMAIAAHIPCDLSPCSARKICES